MFPKPVFFGDTIRAETEVIKARPSSSDPTRGIVTFEHRAFNQAGDCSICTYAVGTSQEPTLENLQFGSTRGPDKQPEVRKGGSC